MPQHPPEAGVDLEGQERDNLKDRERKAPEYWDAWGKAMVDIGFGRFLLWLKQAPRILKTTAAMPA